MFSHTKLGSLISQCIHDKIFVCYSGLIALAVGLIMFSVKLTWALVFSGPVFDMTLVWLTLGSLVLGPVIYIALIAMSQSSIDMDRFNFDFFRAVLIANGFVIVLFIMLCMSSIMPTWAKCSLILPWTMFLFTSVAVLLCIPDPGTMSDPLCISNDAGTLRQFHNGIQLHSGVFIPNRQYEYHH